MIRPFTLVCLLLACGSGLYLFQAKHRVQVLDRQIESTVHATEELRERIRVLHAEWTLQNDPQRLQNLADQFLTLKTVTPGQFTSLAELDSRLPSVPAPEPPVPPVEASMPPQADAPPPQPPPPAPAPVAISKPAPPPPAAPKPAIVAATPSPPARPPEAEHERRTPAPPPQSRSVVAEARPVAAPARPVVTAASRPAVAPPAVAPPAAATAMTGSALGMARSTPMALPRPLPVSASQWVSNGNGGG